MASKRRLDSECVDLSEDAADLKKSKSEKNGSSPTPAEPTEAMEPEAAITVKVAEITNETISIEGISPTAGQSLLVRLDESTSNETQSQDVKTDDDKKFSVEFSNLKPLTKYALKITTPEKSTLLTSMVITSYPSLELPEIEEVQEKCAHLTLAALPEDEAKDVDGYLLLVRPLEDAKDYPAAEIKDPNLESKLKTAVYPPFYIAHEFTQDELAAEDGGAVMVGSGSAKKDGKYGAVQDPKLTSGGNYRVVLVVIMNLEGRQHVFPKESFQMLVK